MSLNLDFFRKLLIFFVLSFVFCDLDYEKILFWVNLCATCCSVNIILNGVRRNSRQSIGILFRFLEMQRFVVTEINYNDLFGFVRVPKEFLKYFQLF